MKRNVGLILTVVALAVAVGLAQAKPNLAGTWVIDKAKSDAPMVGRGPGGGGPGGGGPGAGQMPDITLTITQIDKELVVDRQTGERTQKLTYKLDGSESVNPGMRGSEVKSKARIEGGAIVNEGTQSISTPNGDMTIETKEVWSVSGNVLTIETTSKTPRGENTRKQVFAKKTT